MSAGLQPLALAVSRDRTTLGVMCNVLETLGYRTEGVTMGTDAMRRLGETACDLVVATFGAPPMNGYGLWALMQNTSRFSNVPFVLALNPSEQQRLRMEGREMPATVLIPFTPDGLAAAIERAKRSEVETADVFEI